MFSCHYRYLSSRFLSRLISLPVSQVSSWSIDGRARRSCYYFSKNHRVQSTWSRLVIFYTIDSFIICRCLIRIIFLIQSRHSPFFSPHLHAVAYGTVDKSVNMRLQIHWVNSGYNCAQASKADFWRHTTGRSYEYTDPPLNNCAAMRVARELGPKILKTIDR